MQQYKKLLLNLFKKRDGREGVFSTIKFYAKLMSSNNHFLKKKEWNAVIKLGGTFKINIEDL